MDATLTLTYQSPDAVAEPLDLLLLKQESWAESISKITKGELIKGLYSLIVGTEYALQIDCGFDRNGNLHSLIYAYPRVAGLRYTLYISWGEISRAYVHLIEITEHLQFRLETEATPDLPIRKVLSVVWADQCYGPEGEIVPSPGLTVVGDTVVSDYPVYGTATLVYICEQHIHAASIPRREDAVENHFTSVVAGVYEGGLTHLVVDMPPGIEAFEANAEAVCGHTYLNATYEEEKLGPVLPQLRDRETVVNYCIQKVISDTYTPRTAPP